MFALTVRDYILQLDYKEDLEDYIDNLKNFWNGSETKLIQFMLRMIKIIMHGYQKANIPNMYEVKIESVDVEKFYNEQIEMVLLYVILECILLVN